MAYRSVKMSTLSSVIFHVFQIKINLVKNINNKQLKTVLSTVLILIGSWRLALIFLFTHEKGQKSANIKS